jgi:archaeosine synthase
MRKDRIVRGGGAPRRVVEVVQDRHGNPIEIFDPPFYRNEFEDAYRFIIDDYVVAPKEIALFLPCAVRKPYSQSPSHKLFRRVIDGVLAPEDYHIVIFGTCGTVPAELECMYPYRNYHYMLGKTTDERIRRDFHRIEVYRLKGYLEDTGYLPAPARLLHRAVPEGHGGSGGSDRDRRRPPPLRSDDRAALRYRLPLPGGQPLDAGLCR